MVQGRLLVKIANAPVPVVTMYEVIARKPEVQGPYNTSIGQTRYKNVFFVCF